MRHVTRSPFFSPEISQAIVSDYLLGLSSPVLAKKYNCSKPTILKTLNRLNCPRRQTNRSRVLNEHAFDNAEHNPLAAYFVGLLMADGAILRRENRPTSQAEIVLGLKESDRVLLEQYREFIGSTHTVRRYCGSNRRFGREPGLVLTVSSNHMAETLAKYGVTPRKSFTAKPAILDNSPDFWRGMVDGDGWVTVAESSGKRRRPCIGLTGSLDTVIQFRDFCLSICDFKRQTTRNGRIWSLHLSCRAAYMVIGKLYAGDGPALARKKTAALAILKEFAHLTQPRRWEEKLGVNKEALLLLLQEYGYWEAVAKHLGVSRANFRNIRRRLGLETKRIKRI